MHLKIRGKFIENCYGEPLSLHNRKLAIGRYRSKLSCWLLELAKILAGYLNSSLYRWEGNFRLCLSVRFHEVLIYTGHEHLRVRFLLPRLFMATILLK